MNQYFMGIVQNSGSIGVWSLESETGEIIRGKGVSRLVGTIQRLKMKGKHPKIYAFDIGEYGNEILEECARRGFTIGQTGFKSATAFIMSSRDWFNISVGFATIQNARLMFSHNYPQLRKMVDKSPEEETVERMAHNVRMLVEKVRAEGFRGDTIANAVWNKFAGQFDKSQYTTLFPRLDSYTDEKIRLAYAGAFVYCIPGEYINVLRLDINSAYSWAMSSRPLPYDVPEWGEGKYKHDSAFPLYIQYFVCNFKIKPGKVPFLMIQNNYLYNPFERIRESVEPTFLAMCSVDFELFFDCYEVYAVHYVGFYKFRQSNDIFTPIVSELMEMKNAGDPVKKQRAKDYATALYGKPAQSPEKEAICPVMTETGIEYRKIETPPKTAIYAPLSVFTSAYVRAHLVRAVCANFDRVIYSDTDSLHLLEWDTPEGIPIDPTRLGAWKIEAYEKRARYLKMKCYITEECKTQTGKFKTVAKAAGFPKSAHDKITWENFHYGTTFTGPRKEKHFKGGTVEIMGEYTITPPD